MNTPTHPVAPTQDFELEKHGHTRVDPYYWLNDRDNPQVINYLNAENEYLAATFAHTNDLQSRLFDEIKGRIKEDDSSVPFFENGFWYYTRFEEGKDYPIFCRKKENLEAEEDIMLDANILAEEHEYFSIGSWSINEDNSGRIICP